MESVKATETREVCESIDASPCLAEVHKGSVRTSYTKDNGSYRLLYIWNGPVYPSPPHPCSSCRKHAVTDSSKPQGLEVQSSIRHPKNCFSSLLWPCFQICPTLKTQDKQFSVESRTRTSRWCGGGICCVRGPLKRTKEGREKRRVVSSEVWMKDCYLHGWPHTFILWSNDNTLRENAKQGRKTLWWKIKFNGKKCL